MRRGRLPVAATLAAIAVIVSAILFAVQGASARGNLGAPSGQTAAGHTLSVGGHGEVTATPDMATITLRVQTKASDASVALSDNSTKMTAVITAVEAQGVPASHIQTSNLNLWNDTQQGLYMVDHDVTVRADSVDRVGPILDAAVAAGANSSWGVGFGLKDPSAARSQALQAAIADARKRADAMAAALGVTISGVASASESSYIPPPVRYGPVAATTSPAPAAPTPVQAGQMTVTADVNVVYTLG